MAILLIVDILSIQTESSYFTSFVTGTLIILVLMNHFDLKNRVENDRKRKTAKIMSKAGSKYLKAIHEHERGNNN